MKYHNRKQLDIWKLRDPKRPYLRDESGKYILDKEGHKIMDVVAHITLFDTHPFFQQSFVKAAEFLVKIKKAEEADFEFMKRMKAQVRRRPCTSPIGSIPSWAQASRKATSRKLYRKVCFRGRARLASCPRPSSDRP